MKHITEKYGSETNLLELTNEEYEQLEPFLKQLGVRCRRTISDNLSTTIEAENPYRLWADHPKCREIADEEMTEFRINCYKR